MIYPEGFRAYPFVVLKEFIKMAFVGKAKFVRDFAQALVAVDQAVFDQIQPINGDISL